MASAVSNVATDIGSLSGDHPLPRTVLNLPLSVKSAAYLFGFQREAS